MTHDTIISGAKVVTASGTTVCDIGIRDGRIATLGTGLDGAEVIDATGLIALPGGIDSHVHISQPSGPGIEMADDFTSGTCSAACGGNTMILPFCLPEEGQTLREAVAAYRAKAEGEPTDRAFAVVCAEDRQQYGSDEAAGKADSRETSHGLWRHQRERENGDHGEAAKEGLTLDVVEVGEPVSLRKRGRSSEAKQKPDAKEE